MPVVGCHFFFAPPSLVLHSTDSGKVRNRGAEKMFTPPNKETSSSLGWTTLRDGAHIRKLLVNIKINIELDGLGATSSLQPVKAQARYQTKKSRNSPTTDMNGQEQKRKGLLGLGWRTSPAYVSLLVVSIAWVLGDALLTLWSPNHPSHHM